MKEKRAYSPAQWHKNSGVGVGGIYLWRGLQGKTIFRSELDVLLKLEGEWKMWSVERHLLNARGLTGRLVSVGM